MNFTDGSALNGADGVAVPYGRAGCAAAMAGLSGLVGLVLPTGLLQSIAFQLYLDQVFPSAVPPFGWLAHIVSALVLGVIGAGLGWLLGRLFGVVPSGWTMRHLLDRVRGIGREDDADAPTLRAADRHPDAPARRPFSAATDIPHGGGDTIRPVATARSMTELAHDNDDEELLLDYSFADVPPMTPDSALADPPVTMEDAAARPVVAEVAPAPRPMQAAMVAAAVPNQAGDNLAPGTHAEQSAPAPMPVETAPVPPVIEPGPVAADLAHEPLDALLARLEDGLARREQPAAAPEPKADAIPATDGAGSPAPPAATADSFANDPALAAALATLRRMHQHVG